MPALKSHVQKIEFRGGIAAKGRIREAALRGNFPKLGKIEGNWVKLREQLFLSLLYWLSVNFN